MNPKKPSSDKLIEIAVTAAQCVQQFVKWLPTVVCFPEDPCGAVDSALESQPWVVGFIIWLASNPKVLGSNPSRDVHFFCREQLSMRILPNVFMNLLLFHNVFIFRLKGLFFKIITK